MSLSFADTSTLSLPDSYTLSVKLKLDFTDTSNLSLLILTH
jgi:hypothetical protein